MKPDSAAFLSWSVDRWNEQRFNLLETPDQFAAREPGWFLKELAREWNAHRKALFAVLKPERARLESRCAELANVIGLAVADVRKHRFRPTYTECADLLRDDNGKLSRSKLRAARRPTNRQSDIIKDLVTFSNGWTGALEQFVKQPLARAPIEVLGFPLKSREVPDLIPFLENVAAVRSWGWRDLYPQRLSTLWNLKGKWHKFEIGWPLLVWGDAYERMLNQLSPLHSVAAMSPWSLAQALDLTLLQPSLCEYLGVPVNDDPDAFAGWQLQLQGRYKGWLLAKLGSGGPKRLSHVYPVGVHAIKWHRSPDSQPFLAPMASTLQATTWFLGFLLHALSSRPLAERFVDAPEKTKPTTSKAIQAPKAEDCAIEFVWTPQGTVLHLGSKTLPRQRSVADPPVYVERVLKFTGAMPPEDGETPTLLKDDASRFRAWIRTHFDIVDGSDPLPRIKGAFVRGWHTPPPKNG
jgi:hypothetical protein